MRSSGDGEHGQMRRERAQSMVDSEMQPESQVAEVCRCNAPLPWLR